MALAITSAGSFGSPAASTQSCRTSRFTAKPATLTIANRGACSRRRPCVASNVHARLSTKFDDSATRFEITAART
jgi:hypothetical protein